MSGKSNTKTKIEKYPLPGTVDGICSLIREVLVPGLVQRIEIALDEPVRVFREVSKNDGQELDEDDIDLEAILRNIEVIEYSSHDASPFQVVFDMMQLTQNERLNSVCWVTGPGGTQSLSAWLELSARGMPGELTKLMGLPVHHLKSLSDDTLILCASPYPSAGFDELNLAIKTAIELRRPNHAERTAPSREVDDPVRDDTRVDDPPAHQLAPLARGLRRVDWKLGR